MNYRLCWVVGDLEDSDTWHTFQTSPRERKKPDSIRECRERQFCLDFPWEHNRVIRALFKESKPGAAEESYCFRLSISVILVMFIVLGAGGDTMQSFVGMWHMRVIVNNYCISALLTRCLLCRNTPFGGEGGAFYMLPLHSKRKAPRMSQGEPFNKKWRADYMCCRWEVRGGGGHPKAVARKDSHNGWKDWLMHLRNGTSSV